MTYDPQKNGSRSYEHGIAALHERLWNGFDPGLSYAVACTVPRGEVRAAAELVRLGYTVFLPMLTLHASRRRREPRTALFPGYVFVHLPNGDVLTPQRVRDVSRLLWEPGEGRPATVPGRDLEPLYDGEQAGLFDQRQDVTRLPRGALVRVLDSWLSSRVTTLRSTDGQKRAQVVAYLLGKENVIDVPLEKLRAIG